MIATLAVAAPAMATSGVTYIRNHQTASGGFANPGSPAGVTTTEWAVMGLRAAGVNPAAIRRPGGKTPVGFLATSSKSWSDAYALERGILAVVALRLNPAKFAGRNLIKALRNQVVPSSGRIGAYANSTFWGVLALRGARQSLPLRSVAYIKGRQQANGGYSYLPTKPAGADSNDTAAAIMAMHSAGVPCSDVHIRRALGYLATAHIGGGGYALLPHGSADSQSTSWAVQATAVVRSQEHRGAGVAGQPRHSGRRLVLLRARRPPDPELRHRPSAARYQRQVLPNPLKLNNRCLAPFIHS